MPTFPLIQDQEPQDWWVKHADEQSVGVIDSLKAAGQQAIDRSPVAVLGDMAIKAKFDNMPMTRTLSVNELNEKYNGSGIIWGGPTNEIAAEAIARDHQRKAKLQQTIDLAGGGMGQGVANFLARTVVNLPEYAAGGWAAGGAMRLAGIGAAASVGGAMARGAGEFALGAAPIEMANLARDKQYQYDASMTDSLKNLALAGAMGAAVHGLSFHYGWGEYAKEGKREAPDPIKPDDKAMLKEVAANQLLDNKRPMIEPLVGMMRREAFGEGARPGVDYSGRTFNEFQPLQDDGQFKGKVFNGTTGRTEAPGDLPPGPVSVEGMNLGVGQPGTSDLFLENAKSLPTNGVIHELGVDAKLVNLDAPMKANESKILERFLKENPEVAAKVEKLGYKHGESAPLLRNVYNNLSTEEAAALNQHFSESGYDGLHYEGSTDQASHNGVMIFPEKAASSLTPGQALDSDSRFAGRPSPEDIQKYIESYNAPQNDLFHSEADNAKIAETKARIETGDISTDSESYVDQALKDSIADAKTALNENENLSDEDRALLEEIIKSEAPATAAPKAEEESGPGVVVVPKEPPIATVSAADVAELSLTEKAKLGEGSIKALYGCIGSG